MILCGVIGLGVFVWGIWAALVVRERRASAERRGAQRTASPGRRLSDLITLPADISARQ